MVASDQLAISSTEFLRRGRRLEYFTIAWNSLEGLIGITAGALAGSISLIGFGVDSLIEVTSGGALLWRMRASADHQASERAERIALRIVGACFVALAVYVTYEAVATLLEKHTPERSIVGIVLAAVSLLVMPILARAKRKVSAALECRLRPMVGRPGRSSRHGAPDWPRGHRSSPRENLLRPSRLMNVAQ